MRREKGLQCKLKGGRASTIVSFALSCLFPLTETCPLPLFYPSDNRILVPADDLSWHYAAPDLCAQSQEHARGGKRAGSVDDDAQPAQAPPQPPPAPRYLDCFFLPTTRCRLPSEWRAQAKALIGLNMTAPIVHVAASYGFPFARIAAHNMAVQSSHPVLAAHAGKPKPWWYAQLEKFALRPSDYTLRHLVWPLQQNAFYSTKGVLPHPLAAVFIRAGDKFKEATPMSVDSHFAELAPIAARLGIKDVYVGSDSHDRIAEVLEKYGSTYTIHFINLHRPPAGLAYQDVLSSQRSWRMAELVRLAWADLFITVQADVFVGTLSSNWAELGNDYRRVSGKASVPHLNPETPRGNAWNETRTGE
jgi:hypothetical protein